jgi:DNA-binding transcriptional LysR family regulator
MEHFDLNLLVAFDALMRERNVTRAAASLGVLQPSMSHSLKRLRALCGDPLFVRTRMGMEPTAHAQRLASYVVQGLTALHAGIADAAIFDPAASSRTFQLLMSDIGEVAYLPRLMKRLRKEAPRVALRVLQLPRERYAQALESGDADLAIGFLPALQTGFHDQRLFDDTYVCVVRRNHPRLRGACTLAQFSSESHVVIEPAGTRYAGTASQSSTATLFERVLEDRGVKRNIAVRVPHFMVVPAIVQTSDLVATVPSYVMTAIAPMRNVTVLPLPFDVPRFTVKLFWHARNHKDAANRWLRAIITEICTELCPPPRRSRARGG